MRLHITSTTLGWLLGLSILGAGLLHQPVGALPPEGQSYRLVWQDEFSAPHLDTTAWGYQTGVWGVSGVQNCYTDSWQNVAIQNGVARLTARYQPGTLCQDGSVQQVTSGFIQTKGKKSWTYGYIEARMRLPRHNGSVWPAFWMSPERERYGAWPRSGEINIVETKGHDDGYVGSDAHWGVSRTDRRHRPGGKKLTSSTGDWHVYAMRWQEGRLDFYVDGQVYHTIERFDGPNATQHPGPFNQPFYVRLNLAAGGGYLDVPQQNAQQAIAAFPATMEIDYVRVYQLAPPAKTPNVSSGLATSQSSTERRALPERPGGADALATVSPNPLRSVPPRPPQASASSESPNQSATEAVASHLAQTAPKRRSDRPRAMMTQPATTADETNPWLVWLTVGAGISLVATALSLAYTGLVKR